MKIMNITKVNYSLYDGIVAVHYENDITGTSIEHYKMPQILYDTTMVIQARFQITYIAKPGLRKPLQVSPTYNL